MSSPEVEGLHDRDPETTAADPEAGVAERARLGHQPALDGLRGLAVAAVLLFHGGHLTGGYLGVDAFFVLSGFLITSLLLAEVTSTGHVSLRAFWARRARRLLPALACVLGAVALYAAFVAQPNELATIRGDALATMAYVANWRQIFTSNDYFALFRSPSPLQHTWSLSIEEQFYVLWPLVFLAVTRGRTAADAVRRVFVTACVGTAVSFVLMQVTFKASDTSRAYYGTDTRMSSILVGVALAAALVLWGPVVAARRRQLESAAIVAALVLACAWARLSGTSPTLYRGGFLVCAIATAAVIAAGVHPDRGPVSRALSWRPLRELGLISYGVYLWHWPIFVFVDADRAHLTGWPLFVVRVAITLFVSVVSFRLIERPVRYGTQSSRLMLRITPVVVIGLVVAIFASTAGAPAVSAAATTSHGGLLVVGDSVANSLFPGIVRAGIPAEEAWSVGCRLLNGQLSFTAPYSADCPWRPLWRKAIDLQRPKVVLMVIGAWDLFDLKPPGYDHFIAPGSRAWNAYYALQLEDAIKLLSSRGARVVIPSLPCQGTIPGAPHFDARSSFNVDRVRAANAVLKQVVARHPDVVASPDLFDYLCPLGKFQKGAQGVDLVRRDGVHYTDEGAALVTAFLSPYLGPSAPANDGSGHLVLVYGDSLAAEAHHSLFDALPTSSGLRPETTAVAFAAVCDMVGWLRSDLANKHASLAVLETHGGDSTRCMRDSSGNLLVRDSTAYYAKFHSDVADFFRTAHAAGVPVLVVATPPEAFPAGIAEQARLASIIHDVARSYPATQFSNLGRDALGGTQWARTLPCLPEERSRSDCHNGQIVVRGPDNVHFCPTLYPTVAAFNAGCPEYSSGAIRYGRAIAAAIVAASKQLAPPPP